MKRSSLPVVAGLLAAALVGLLIFGVVQRREDKSLDSAVSKGQRPLAPGASIQLPRLQGSGTASLASLRGRVVVLNFWASWCDVCLDEAPALQSAQRRLARTGGAVIGVTYRDDASASRSKARELGMTYPSLRDDKLALAPKFGTIKLPETFVLDAGGRVVAISRGQVRQDFLDRAIARAQQST